MLDELLVGLGFDFDSEDIEKFNSEIDKGLSLVKTFATTVAAGTAALVGFSTAVTAAVDRQGKLSDETDIAIGTIDALAFAMSRVGADSNSLEGDIRGLSIGISEAARGMGSAVEAFGILGISATDANGQLKPTVDVLMEVADAIQGLPRSQQYELVNKVGLGNSIRLLQQGSEGIRELIGEAEALGVATAEDAALSAEFQDSLTNLSLIGKDFSRLLSRELTPIVENVANQIESWWKANRELIQQQLPVYVEQLTKGIKLLVLASAAFIAMKLVTTLLAMAKAFRSVQIAALLANVAIAAIPLLITGLISAFALLAEDANVFFEGGESFIGKMLKQYPEWNNQIIAAAAAFKTLYDLTGMIFDGWGMIFDLFSTDFSTHLEAFKLIFQDMGEYINGVFSNVVDNIQGIFTSLWENIKNKFEENVTQPISKGLDRVSNFFGFGDEETNNPSAQNTSPVEKVSKNITELAGSFDIPQIEVGDLPSFDIPQIEVGDLPSFDMPLLGFEDLPSGGFGFDMASFQGFTGETDGTLTENTINRSDTNQSINNQTSISLGGIKVEVNGNEDTSGTTRSNARQIARDIARELEPVWEQASRDLNSGVEL